MSDFTKLRRVYEFAKRAHTGMRRKNGDIYISHPRAVYRIVKGYGGDKISMFASILHDVVEETKVPLSDIEGCFGKEISFLVDSLTGRDLEEVVRKLGEYSKKDK